MTGEEAIKQLETLRSCMLVDHADYCIVESLNMAIKALENMKARLNKMEIIPVEYLLERLENDKDVMYLTQQEIISVRFNERELKSLIYHLRTLKILEEKQND